MNDRCPSLGFPRGPLDENEKVRRWRRGEPCARDSVEEAGGLSRKEKVDRVGGGTAPDEEAAGGKRDRSVRGLGGAGEECTLTVNCLRPKLGPPSTQTLLPSPIRRALANARSPSSPSRLVIDRMSASSDGCPKSDRWWMDESTSNVLTTTADPPGVRLRPFLRCARGYRCLRIGDGRRECLGRSNVMLFSAMSLQAGPRDRQSQSSARRRTETNAAATHRVRVSQGSTTCENRLKVYKPAMLAHARPAMAPCCDVMLAR